MAARNTAHVHAPAESAAKPVMLHPAASNDGAPSAPAEPATLDTLLARLGAPTPVMQRIAFQGYDPAAGLDAGRAVATDRILTSVPEIAQSALSIWESLPAEGRAKVVGFAPGLVAVLVYEAAVLRSLNDRYDAAAKRDAVMKTRCEAKAAVTLRDGRALRDDTLRLVRRFVAPAQQEAAALQVTADGAERAAAIALSSEALADWTASWLRAMPAEERATLATMGVDVTLAATLRRHATAMRAAKAAVDALHGESRVTQVQLDAQDGRVLHAVDVIQAAFRTAARRDVSIRVPALGALHRRFARSHRRTATPKVAAPKTSQPS